MEKKTAHLNYIYKYIHKRIFVNFNSFMYFFFILIWVNVLGALGDMHMQSAFFFNVLIGNIQFMS